jgi:hypothetical protein
MVIIYLEAEDSALDAMRKGSESEDDFWNQLESSLEGISGTHPDEVSAKPPQLLFDWHHERGHSRTHHPV